MDPTAFTALVADDHEITRYGTSSLLKRIGARHVTGVNTGSEAIRVLQAHAPDLVVTELSLPGRSGLDVLRHAHRERLFAEGLTVGIVLTSKTTDPWVSGAFRSGATGYVLKSEPAGEVRAAIRTVLSGERYLSEVLPTCLMEKADAPCAVSTKKETMGVDIEVYDRLHTLTARERQVLTLRGQSLTYQEIGNRLSISWRTAEKHGENARSKLQLRNAVDVVAYAHQRGLVPETADNANR